MFYKAITTYKLKPGFDIHVDALQASLEDFKFVPCIPSDISKIGFAPVITGSEVLFHITEDAVHLKVVKDVKEFSAPAIQLELNKRCAVIEKAENRKLTRKERTLLKDEIIYSLVPTTLPTRKAVNIMIDTKSLLVFVDTTSAIVAEGALALIRKALGSFPVMPLAVVDNPSHTMTEWAKGALTPIGATIADMFTLESDSSEKVKASNADISDDTYQQHLTAGMWVSSIGLQYDSACTLAISDKLVVSNLKFSELVTHAEEGSHDDVQAEQDASLFILHAQLNLIVSRLVESFGGFEQPL
jgi:recombination associated protein RdgC